MPLPVLGASASIGRGCPVHPCSPVACRPCQSRRDPSPPRGGPAERALFRALVDDAAVFPPGNAAPPRRRARSTAATASSRRPPASGPLLVARRRGRLTCGPPARARTAARGGRRPGPAPPSTWWQRAVDRAAPRATADRGRGQPSSRWSRLAGRTLGWGCPLVRARCPRGPTRSRRSRTSGTTRPRTARCRRKFRTGATDDVGLSRTRPSWPRSCARASTGPRRSSSPAACTTPSRHTAADGEEQHGLAQRPLRHPLGAGHGAEVPELVALAGANGIRRRCSRPSPA